MTSSTDLIPTVADLITGYAARGWYVFPCHSLVDGKCTCGASCMSPGKHPIPARGWKDASSDDTTVRQWWTQHPWANVGLALAPSGLVVLDVDVRDGKPGIASLAALGDLPPTLSARTGSGGFHAVYTRPAGVTLSSRIGFRPGLDLIVNGYIILPPSLHVSGGRYEWLNDTPVAPLPDVLRAFATAGPTATRSPLDDIDERADQPQSVVTAARERLRRHGPAVAGQAGDKHTVVAGAILLRDYALPWRQAWPLAVEWNAGCTPPWGADELAVKLRNGAVYGTSPPGIEVTRLRDLEDLRGLASAREPEPEPDPGANPGDGTAPFRHASIVVNRAAEWRETVANVRKWRGVFYSWNAARGHYREMTTDEVHKSVYDGLAYMEDLDQAAVAKLLHAAVAVPGLLIDQVSAPGWIDRRDVDGTNYVVCPNGLLYLPTMTLTPATPELFTLSTIGVPYTPGAAAPSGWLLALEQWFGGDREAIDCLQEWFGYLLVPDTRQQKILLLWGPKRSGKGTVARILRRLLGNDACAGPTLSSLTTNFGLQPLIGKQAAIISDARLGGKSDQAMIAERLLSVSGEDGQTIDRKHREAWSGYLPTRFVILSNELPRLQDASGALASRFVVLQTRVSYIGREDTGLTARLQAELPGILLWAIDGWRRLRERGHFVQPTASADAVRELEDLASPVGQFLRETCRPEPDATVVCVDLYRAYTTWCMKSGVKPVSASLFGRDVLAAGYGKKRARIGGTVPWLYSGLALNGSPSPDVASTGHGKDKEAAT